jgi:hypothetical protein
VRPLIVCSQVKLREFTYRKLLKIQSINLITKKQTKPKNNTHRNSRKREGKTAY